MPFCTKSHKTVIQSIHTEGLCSSHLPGRACSPSFCFLSFHLPLSLSSLMTKSKQEWNDSTWWSAEAGLCRADPKTAKLPSQTVFAHKTLLLHQERVLHFCWWVRNLQQTSRLAGRYDNCHSTCPLNPHGHHWLVHERHRDSSAINWCGANIYKPDPATHWAKLISAQHLRSMGSTRVHLAFLGKKTSEFHTGLLHSLSS